MESRVVVVGEWVFGVRIDAGSAAAHVDWRSDYPNLTYHLVTSPAGVLDGARAVIGAGAALVSAKTLRTSSSA